MASSNIFNKSLLTLLSNKSNLLSEMPMGTTLSLRTSLEMLDQRRCHSDKPSQFKLLLPSELTGFQHFIHFDTEFFAFSFVVSTLFYGPRTHSIVHKTIHNCLTGQKLVNFI